MFIGIGVSPAIAGGKTGLGAPPATPVNSVPPAISGSAIEGSTVTCSTGTWSNSPTSYAYQWKRNGSPIVGATSSSYTLAAADDGQSITCTVTATNAAGSGSATSNAITPTASGGGAGSPTLAEPPEMSGIPQSGQLISLYGGEYSTAPTHLRYNVKRLDPVTQAVVNTTTTTKDVGALGDAAYSHQYTPTDADVEYGYGATVDASFDNQTTWAISTDCNINTAYPSDVVLPKVIPNPTVTWNPATQQFDVSAKPYMALIRLYKTEDQNLSGVKQYGYLSRSQSELTGTQSIDITGATDPAPDPVITAMLDTDVFYVQDVTPDYQYTGEDNNIVGSASDWIGASPTSVAGASRIRFTCNANGPCWSPEMRVKYGGINILQSLMLSGNYQFGRALRSSIDKATWDPGTGHPPTNFVGNDVQLGVMFLNDWIEFDWSVNLPEAGLSFEIDSNSGFGPFTDFTIQVYAKDGTLLNTITRTGLTYTANETKIVAL